MELEAPVPASFGPYKIVAPLGRGGVGEVYRAWDPRLEREVALKILRRRTETNPDRIQRFIAEARAASALNHPNILTVFDAAVDHATPYLVTELLEGETLAAEVRRGPIAIKRMLDLATQVADGLAEAHAAGIVHGDLKPDNILITRTGRAKILDFGLARSTGSVATGRVPDVSDQTATEPGLLAGTVPYMSPEQARGAATDFRSDQFSLGLVLYEMAVGRPAFWRATPAETLAAIRTEEPVPVPALNPQAPLVLSWIIERCLAKSPADRYGVTADLHRDLRVLRDRLGEALAREAPAREPDGAGRAARRMLPVVAVLALVIAAAVIARLAAGPPGPDLAAMRFVPLATDTAYEAYPAWSPDGLTIAYAANSNGVLQVFTRRRGAPTAAKVTEAPYDAKYPFWSPDGRRLYYISLAGNRDGLWSVATGGGLARNVLRNASRAAISRDGTLAFLRDEDRADIVGTAALWLADADGGNQRRYDRAPFDELRFSDGALAFSPNGRRLGVCAVPGTIALEPERRGWQFWILPMPTGEPVRRLAGQTDISPRMTDFSWFPDSRHVALGKVSTAASGAHLWMADLDRDRVWPLAPGTGSDYAPSVSLDGTIAFTSGESDYDLYELPLDRSPARALIATSRNEADAAWAPDGQAFAYVTDRTGQDEIWRRRIDDALSDQRLVDFGNDQTLMLGAPSFSPDGERLAFQRNAGSPVWPLRIWHSLVGGGQPSPLVTQSHDGYQGSPTWSPNGEWIAFAQWSAKQWRLMKVRVGSADSPEELRADGVANPTPRWSPAGTWITWETDQGFVLVSPDGRQVRPLAAPRWLEHTWSADGSEIYGIHETDDLRLVLIALNIRTERERQIQDLGPSPPVNNPVKGLSFNPIRQSFLTALVRMRGDIWLLEGVRPPRGLLERLWPDQPR